MEITYLLVIETSHSGCHIPPQFISLLLACGCSVLQHKLYDTLIISGCILRSIETNCRYCENKRRKGLLSLVSDNATNILYYCVVLYFMARRLSWSNFISYKRNHLFYFFYLLCNISLLTRETNSVALTRRLDSRVKF